MLERLGKVPIAAPRMRAPLKGIQPAWALLLPNECLGCWMVMPGIRSGSENVGTVQNKKKKGGEEKKPQVAFASCLGEGVVQSPALLTNAFNKVFFPTSRGKKPKNLKPFPIT